MSTQSLDRLEELVARASSRLRELEEENSGLRERVSVLERGASERTGGEGVASDAGQDEWRNERDELVARVEKLVGGLDELLASVEGAG
ncbi:MAG TPA: cell division protein ZapB [Thermoanaerobaculia bacterium]|nr:cell division protein ZapB [Thermoanaerobaculia bacterium]